MKFIQNIMLLSTLLLVSSNIFYAKEQSLFTPEQIAHMKDTNSYLDLKNGLANGTISQNALLRVANQIIDKQLTEEAYKDLPLFVGQIHAVLFGCGYRIGMDTCSINASFAGFQIQPTVSTKKLLLTTTVAIALAVAYKKGYFTALKNYVFGAHEDQEDDQI